MQTFKNLLIIFMVFLITLGIQAQVTKAGVYSINSNDDMYGIALRQGTIIFNESDKNTYLLTDEVEATQSLNSTPGKVLLSSSIEGLTGSGTYTNVADISQYGVPYDGTSDVSEAIKLAMTEADVIFFPGSKQGKVYTISGSLRIPLNKTFRLEEGAMINVTGNLIGAETRIDAKPQQIFTSTSKLTGTWKSDAAYPEWFGAKSGSFHNSAPAIQKTIDVFQQNIWLTGTNYKVNASIKVGAGNSFYMKNTTELIPSAGANKDLFIITGEPFVIKGGRIKIEKGYNSWVFNVSIDRKGDADHTPRFTSVIRDIIVEGYMYGQHNFSGLAYNGIKLNCAEKNDYSYFSLMDNVNFYRPDTAIYLTGHKESGMNNSWHWNNITIDWSMRGIILDKKAAGHSFTNLIIQPNTRAKTTQIEVASKYNSFQGVIWDIHFKHTIHLKSTAAENWFSHMGRVDLYERFVLDESQYKSNNVFSTTNPFEPTKNRYSYYAKDRMMIGFKDNRSSNVPRFAVKSSDNGDAVTAAFIKKVWNIGGNTNLGSAKNVKHAIILSAQTNVKMIDGFGTGLTFTVKDPTTDSVQYDQNVMGRIYARRDGSNTRGLMQFFTKGENAAKPAMTIRNSGFVGIGTTAPRADLHVEGDLIVGGTNSNTVTINDLLNLTPRGAPPSSPNTGDIYVGTDNHIYCFLGGLWKQLD